MYLRHATRVKDGKAHTYWRLVRSVRMGRKVVQQTVAHLGELDAEGRARAKSLARAMTGDREQPDLFAPVERSPEPVRVRLDRVRLERGRTFGDVWLGWTLWRALHLDEVCARLLPAGREEVPWTTMAAVLVLARAQVVVVPCDRDAAVRRRQHISAHPACDVDAAMGTQPWIALCAEPVAKARVNSRSSVSRGRHRTHKVGQRQKHEKHHRNDIDDHGREAQARFHAAVPHELNERVHERKHDQRGTSRGQGRKGESWYPLGYPRRVAPHDHQYSHRQAEPEDPPRGEAPARVRLSHDG